MKKRRILVVDDEFHITEIVRMVLEKAGGYAVKTLNKSAHALDVARSFKPDLIMLDLMMPGLTGDQLFRELRKDRALQQVPVLMFTSVATKQDLTGDDGLIGGLPFLAKPTNPRLMLQTIERTLAG